MERAKQFLIVNDFSIFTLLILFFIGFLVYDHELVGIKEPLFEIPEGFKVFFEFLPWILFLLLTVDLYLKYNIVERKLTYFVKKYWSDILLTIVLPFLFPLKFFAATFKIYKYAKFAKSAYNLSQKYKKLFKIKNK
jgi:hypothetical protein